MSPLQYGSMVWIPVISITLAGCGRKKYGSLNFKLKWGVFWVMLRTHFLYITDCCEFQTVWLKNVDGNYLTMDEVKRKKAWQWSHHPLTWSTDSIKAILAASLQCYTLMLSSNVCTIHTHTTLSRHRHIVQKVSLKYTFNKQRPPFFAALLLSQHSQNSPFRIKRIHAAVVLAAAGHSGDKSGEVSPGNGLQKGSGS